MTDELIKRAEGWLEVMSGASPLEAEIAPELRPPAPDYPYETAYKLIQDLLTALKGKGWMPIESAEKNGMIYLLWDGDYMRRGSWKKDLNSNREGWYDEHGDDFSTGSYYCPLTPTHFQYLPTPPTDSEAK
jgi:hypothetical protein